MGDIYLHPTYPLFKQLKRPMCPCGAEILPMTPVVVIQQEDKLWMFYHKGCEPHDETGGVA